MPPRISNCEGDSGAASQPPAIPPPTLRHRLSPHAGLLTLELVSPASLLGLVDGLATDAKSVSDLGPGSAIATRGAGQQVPYIRQGVFGVSHLPKSVQRPLGASQGARQVLNHPASPQTCVGALVGAHVNGYWQCPQTSLHPFPSIPVDRSSAANSGKHVNRRKEVNGAPTGDISTPGDYVLPRAPIFGPTQPKKETPQERQLLGVVDDIRGN